MSNLYKTHMLHSVCIHIRIECSWHACTVCVCACRLCAVYVCPVSPMQEDPRLYFSDDESTAGQLGTTGANGYKKKQWTNRQLFIHAGHKVVRSKAVMHPMWSLSPKTATMMMFNLFETHVAMKVSTLGMLPPLSIM